MTGTSLRDEERLALTPEERLAIWRARKALPAALPSVSHLWVTCLDCGRLEVAGWYCSYCFLPTYERDFYASTERIAEPVNWEVRDAAIARHGRLSERVAVELRPTAGKGSRLRVSDPAARQQDIERRRAARAAGKP